MSLSASAPLAFISAPIHLRPYRPPSLRRRNTCKPSSPRLCPTSQQAPPNAQRTPPPPEDDTSVLEELQSAPDEPEDPDSPWSRIDQSRGTLASLIDYIVVGDFNTEIDTFLKPTDRLVLGAALAILFGFFSATSASTIIGSVADWDPLAAAVLLIWTESFTKYYYSRNHRSRLLQLINAFKIGLIYGMTVDAFKLST